ncbi:MAG: hypothetical protein JWN54_2726, partial [Mycobacterium sp.]|nr:hypothetical protein [Mycobacterium sp.]
MGRYGQRIALSARGRHPVRETATAVGVLLVLIVPGVVTSLDGFPGVLDRVQAAFGGHPFEGHTVDGHTVDGH